MGKKISKQLKKLIRKVLKHFSEKNIARYSLIISILTLFLGYVAYKKFLANNFKNEQLNLVIEVVRTIQNDSIQVNRYTKEWGPMGTGPNERIGNIFGIGNFEIKNNYDLYIPGDFRWSLKTDNYLFNPLLPENIAATLVRLRTDMDPQIGIKLDTLKYLHTLGNPPDSNLFLIRDLPNDFIIGNRKYNGGMQGFVRNTKNVTEEIIKYFEDNNIKTINPLIFENQELIFPDFRN
ncbi:MAG: hypothetical protein CML05_05135 [Pseudozobellia sp.]|nr:hypothetical protein [Pseudozobellia sp.]